MTDAEICKAVAELAGWTDPHLLKALAAAHSWAAEAVAGIVESAAFMHGVDEADLRDAFRFEWPPQPTEIPDPETPNP